MSRFFARRVFVHISTMFHNLIVRLRLLVAREVRLSDAVSALTDDRLL